jgi:type II secretory pathway component PulK
MIKLRQNNRGVALLFVMGALMIIAIIAIELTQQSQMAKQTVIGKRDEAKAIELAKAAYRWSVFRLTLDTQLDAIPVIPGTNYGGKKDDLTEMQWTFPLTYPFPVPAGEPDEEMDDSAETLATQESLGGSFVTSLSDESARINLNDVGIGGPPGQKVVSGAAKVLSYLLSSPRFQKYFRYDQNGVNRVIHAIDDWTDSDTQINHLGGGDENQEYSTGDDPYQVKNMPFFALSELRRIEAIDLELLEELLPFVTVYPYDAKLPRVSTQPITPKGKINVNTAPVELLAALFSPQMMTSNRARLECAVAIANARALMAFRSVKPGGTEPSFLGFVQNNCEVVQTQDENGAASIVEKEILAILDVRSDVFRVHALGISGNIQKTISAVVVRSQANVQPVYWKVQ